MARIVKECLIIESGFAGTVSAPPRARVCRDHFLIGGGLVGEDLDQVVRLVVASSVDYWKIASDEFLFWD